MCKFLDSVQIPPVKTSTPVITTNSATVNNSNENNNLISNSNSLLTNPVKSFTAWFDEKFSISNTTGNQITTVEAKMDCCPASAGTAKVEQRKGKIQIHLETGFVTKKNSILLFCGLVISQKFHLQSSSILAL